MVEKRQLINADEVSQMLGIRKDTVYRWVSQKRIPHVKLGRKTAFIPKIIDEWIATNSIAAKDFY